MSAPTPASSTRPSPASPRRISSPSSSPTPFLITKKKTAQLFCDKSAKAIIELLVHRARERNVKILLDQKVGEISNSNGGFTVPSNGETYSAPRLVVATGGLSWPQLGASDLGFKIARQFGLNIMEPSPALAGLAFPEKELVRFEGLAGIHLNVSVACGAWKMQEDIMITHKGLSGPVMLNASLYWNPGMEITVNWVPELTVESTFEQLKKDRVEGGRGEFRIWLSERIPRRLAERLAWHAGARGAWPALNDGQLLTLSKTIHAYRFIPSDTFGYRMAEVMRGGLDTKEVSSKTMENTQGAGTFFHRRGLGRDRAIGRV